jgi:hypothetical protein
VVLSQLSYCPKRIQKIGKHSGKVKGESVQKPNTLKFKDLTQDSLAVDR